MENELKARIIAALKTSSHWGVDACVKLFEASDDPRKVVVPASMPHLTKFVNSMLGGVK